MTNPYLYLNKSDKELENYLNKLKDAYYNKNQLVSDEVFDDLRDELYKRNPNSSFFSEVGYKSNNDIKLPYKMYSLDKITPTKNNFNKWISKYNGPYSISDKLDGISCLITKTNKINIYLRSTADLGSDISYIYPYIKIGDIPTNYAIRGELIISKNNFLKLNKNYKSPRMCVNGIIKHKIVNKSLLQYVDFIAYSIVYPRYKQSEQYKILNNLHFNTVYNKIFDKITLDLMVDYFKLRKHESDYELDGIVICDNSKIYDYPTTRNPDYQIAFKSLYNEQAHITKIINIQWNLSKYGVYCPTIEIEPVDILDSTIKYVTGHNAKYIVDNSLGPGAVIKIIKSGDIIPHILEVLIPAKKPQLPTEKYTWNDSGVDIIITKNINHKQLIEISAKQLLFTMTTLNIIGFGENRIKKICETYNCTTLYDIINLGYDKLQQTLGPNIGTQIYDDLLLKIQSAPLIKMMLASNCFDSGLIGEKRLKIILREIPDILTRKNIRDIILNIPSFKDKTADAVVTGIDNFKLFLIDFNNNQNKIKLNYKSETSKSNESNITLPFKKVVITGTRDKSLMDFLLKSNIDISSSVNKKTDLCIYVNNEKTINGVKYKTAKNLNIPLIEINKFMDKYVRS